VRAVSILGLSAITLDIVPVPTHQRATEALESISDAFVALDREWRYTYVNRRAAELLGKRVDGLIGRSPREIFPFTVGGESYRECHRAMAEQVPVQFVTYVPALGRWYENRVFPSEQGLSIYWSDITERKRSEEALEAATERLAQDLDVMMRLHGLATRFVRAGDLEAVLDEIVEAAIAITHADMGNIQLLDPASRQLKVEAYRGHERWWLDFFDHVPAGPGASCGKALEEGARIVIEDVTTSPVFVDTPALEVQLRAGIRAVQSTPLLGSAGSLVGMLSTHYRTPRRPDERDLRLLDLLARLAADMIENARAADTLRKAHETIKESDRRKDEFLGMLSHELRNPLAPIRNSTYILRHAAPGSDQARRAQSVIERQAQHLTRLVEDLLDVTRIARGKIELRRERVDLREVVLRAADDFRLLLDDRGVTFRLELPDEKVWADIDVTRITQVVGNLMQNAAKFTRRGDEVALVLMVVGDGAEIRVRDSGAGIDVALLPRVFDAFVQGARTLARTKGGLGLGLALVKGITELHGGKVRVESGGQGKGAEFVVQLPLTPAGLPQNEKQWDQGNAHRRHEDRHVLVVEDNPDAAESLADMVRILGYPVEVAYDGPSAIEKAGANPPDVVLCDIGLPGMSGYEVAKALRGTGSRGIQLFAVSGYAQPEDVQRAAEAGFDGHLAKPCDPEQIERLLS